MLMLENSKSKHRLRKERQLYHQLDRAQAERDEKLKDGKLSLPKGAGRLVIAVSNAVDNDDGHFSPREQIDIVQELAERLQEERGDEHQEVSIEPASELGLKMNLSDPEVTDLILVGHGSIGDYWTNGGGHFNWRDAANATRRLKQGSIEQLTCGDFPSRDALHVPVGTFAVSDTTKLIGAPGVAVPDIRDDDFFHPIYEVPLATVEDVVALNELYGVTVPERPVK